jgi:hypothetical protein
MFFWKKAPLLQSPSLFKNQIFDAHELTAIIFAKFSSASHHAHNDWFDSTLAESSCIDWFS